jgi:hypothetical protein
LEAGLLELALVLALLKKRVICRWAGSLAAPANWRFVRGADISCFRQSVSQRWK